MRERERVCVRERERERERKREREREDWGGGARGIASLFVSCLEPAIILSLFRSKSQKALCFCPFAQFSNRYNVSVLKRLFLTLSLHCSCIVLTLFSHCSYIVLTLFLHCSCIVLVLFVHCSCIVLTL